MSPAKERGLPKVTRYEKFLVLLFLLTLPLSNPWVRGDGVGYYAFARSLLIEHRLDFKQDWLRANASFRMGRVDPAGQIEADEFTTTGHLNNHFAVGPAMLWMPLLLVAHVGVILYDRLGGNVPADGYSRPYVTAMALETALYGFLALLIGFRLARERVPEQWAFLATIGIWLGTSLPVYMALNPSWSHAPSAFTDALFLWYWNRTRKVQNLWRWAILGLIGGLAMDVYYLNIVLFLAPIAAAVSAGLWGTKNAKIEKPWPTVAEAGACGAATFAAFCPTLVTKKIIYGNYFNFGYTEHWYWNSPAILRVCFSADHGLFSWTPMVLLAVAGIFLLYRYDREFAIGSAGIFLGYLYLVGCYEDWDGVSSFGSRFFVSLTALFVVGLAVLFDLLAQAWQKRGTEIVAWGATSALVLWNIGLIFQWGTHLIPPRGPISWRDAAYNQVAVVPARAESVVRSYFTHRSALMNQIEEQDVKQLKSAHPQDQNQ